MERASEKRMRVSVTVVNLKNDRAGQFDIGADGVADIGRLAGD